MRMISYVPRHVLAGIIRHSKGHMLSVEFRKKDGSYRKLNGRVGVQQHCKGVRAPASRCITMWEAPKPQEGQIDLRSRYRNVRPEALIRAKIDGIEYRAV